MKDILINYGKKLIDNNLITYDALESDYIINDYLMNSILPERTLKRLSDDFYNNEETILGTLQVYYIEVKNAA